MAKTVFLNRMPANDTDNTVAYGLDDTVMHQVERNEKNEYADQIAFEQKEKGDDDG